NVLLGENVQASPDGLTYTAAIDGIVLRDGNRIRVINSYEVKGDVDFSSGSLDLEKSGVVVRGAIRSTFSVKANGTIVVEDSIEDAIVESTGDIEVAKGIVNGKLGSVTAGGCVRAAFAQYAEVLAGDSIEIRDSAFHSLLVAKNVVSVREGKGVLVGGHTVAGQRIEVRVAGSKANTQTVLQVGLDYEAVKAIDQELQVVEREMAKVVAAGGDNLAHYAKPGGSAPKDPRIRELLGSWREVQAKKQKLLSKRAGLLDECVAELGDDAVIVVGEIAHRGVKMIIGNASLQITDTVHGGRFVYDSERGGIRRVDA
ncbi:MAG: FapA family protein, partial [Planctomycetota bacterium]